MTYDPSPSSDSGLWLFGAKPGTVVGGGLLLLVLAAILLFAGQRDATGTIVMLSICLAPLALITIAIGLARAVSRTTQRQPRAGGPR
jgi:ABC-type multidrug transport system permease subunit